ncbi:hypothetical protein A5672_22655 [Mycobacterium alsense]|uniref:Uncharacterized protein n=1 Tax=Mycobacterium alsense TaxID=324058 RepID=A0ABD6NXJ2_9MYCO|nr:hypothetical protein A5672_22655 [Mycobacterium alsense]OBJ05239.1 hypothetical protein A5660_17065 [Mycobacterium alsense]
MIVLVSVLGEAVTVLGGTVVVGVSVLGGGAVSVTVSVGTFPPPPPPWWRGGAVVVVVVVTTEEDVVGAVVVVVGAGGGGPATSLITAYAASPSTITPTAPAATSAHGRRYHGVGGSGGEP